MIIKPVTNANAKRLKYGLAFLLLFASFINTPLMASNGSLQHRLLVDIVPASGTLRVEDELRVDPPVAKLEFTLNSGLELETSVGRLDALDETSDGLLTRYRLVLETPTDSIKLHYHGRPVFSERVGHGGMPQGVISAKSVYLDGNSAWYPVFAHAPTAVELTVHLPKGWQAVSIGRRHPGLSGVRWHTERPHDDIYLIADRFARYARAHKDVELSIWLLDDDPALAERYLGLMAGYIDHYSKLIGDYPYGKFAVVENRWQTGYGMPSFTLLGSRVLRLPFIPYTSLPHEILHNWWGNGVWVDYRRGNWSEGLTAYLADHWMKERRGQGAAYRLKALQRFTNYAAEGADLPLLQFVSRHDDASQSVGYSKSLMLFHMLRLSLGDEAFSAGLRRLWQDHRYTAVGFEQAVRSISADRPELAAQMRQWLVRPGAPRIRLGAVTVRSAELGHQVQITLHQEQDSPFALELPIALTLENEVRSRLFRVRMDKAQQRFSFDVPGKPLRIDIDPAYDVLRELHPSEQPPALSRLFGGPTLVVLPGDAPLRMRTAWQALARQWQARYPGLQIVTDHDLDAAPQQGNMLLLGWDNRLLPVYRAAFRRDDQMLAEHGITIEEQAFDATAVGAALVRNTPAGNAMGLVLATSPAGVADLARRLTHYGSYGRLVFDQASGENLRRDTLPATDSRLTRQLGPAGAALRLEPPPPLRTD